MRRLRTRHEQEWNSRLNLSQSIREGDGPEVSIDDCNTSKADGTTTGRRKLQQRPRGVNRTGKMQRLSSLPEANPRCRMSQTGARTDTNPAIPVRDPAKTVGSRGDHTSSTVLERRDSRSPIIRFRMQSGRTSVTSLAIRGFDVFSIRIPGRRDCFCSCLVGIPHQSSQAKGRNRTA